MSGTISPTSGIYPPTGNENLPNVDPGVIKPVIPAGAPEEVPGVHNETIAISPSTDETPDPAPGKSKK